MADKNTTLQTSSESVALDALYHGSTMKQDVKEGEILTIDRGMVAEANPNKAENETVIAVRNDEGPAAVLNRITLEPGGGLEVKKVDKSADPTSRVKRLITVEYLTPDERAEKLKEPAPVKIPKKQTLDFASSDPDPTGKPLGSAVSESDASQTPGMQSQSSINGRKIGSGAFSGESPSSQMQESTTKQTPQRSSMPTDKSPTSAPISKESYEELKELRKSSPLEAEQILKESLTVPVEQRPQYISRRVQDSQKKKDASKSRPGTTASSPTQMPDSAPISRESYDELKELRKDSPLEAEQILKESLTVPKEQRPQYISRRVQDSQKKRGIAKSRPVATGVATRPLAQTQAPAQTKLEDPMLGAVPETPTFAPKPEQSLSGVDGIDDLVASEKQTPSPMSSDQLSESASIGKESYDALKELRKDSPLEAEQILKESMTVPKEQRPQYISRRVQDSRNRRGVARSGAGAMGVAAPPYGQAQVPAQAKPENPMLGAVPETPTFAPKPEKTFSGADGVDDLLASEQQKTTGMPIAPTEPFADTSSDIGTSGQDVSAPITGESYLALKELEKTNPTEAEQILIEALNKPKEERDQFIVDAIQAHSNTAGNESTDVYGPSLSEAASFVPQPENAVSGVDGIDDLVASESSLTPEKQEESSEWDKFTSENPDVAEDWHKLLLKDPAAANEISNLANEMPLEQRAEFIRNELTKHDLSDTESLTDQNTDVLSTTDDMSDNMEEPQTESADIMSGTEEAVAEASDGAVEYDETGSDFNIDDDNKDGSDTSLDIDLEDTPGDATDLSLEIEQDNSDETTVNVDVDADGTPDAVITQEENADDITIEALNDGNIEVSSDSEDATSINLDEGESVQIEMQADGDVELNYDTDGDGDIDTTKEVQLEDLDIDLNTESENIDDLDLDKGDSVHIEMQEDGDVELQYDTDGDGQVDAVEEVDAEDVEIKIDTESGDNSDVNLDEGDSVQIEMQEDGDVELQYDTDGDGQMDVVEEVDAEDVAIELNAESGGSAEIEIGENQGEATLEIDIDNDGSPDVEIQPEADNTADEDVNIDMVSEASVDVDTNDDGVAEVTVETEETSVDTISETESENTQMNRAKPAVVLDEIKNSNKDNNSKGRMKRGTNTRAPIMPTPILSSSDKGKSKSKMPSFFKPPKLAGKRR